MRKVPVGRIPPAPFASLEVPLKEWHGLVIFHNPKSKWLAYHLIRMSVVISCNEWYKNYNSIFSVLF